MRNRFVLAIITALVIVGCAMVKPTVSEHAPAQLNPPNIAQAQSQQIAALHHDDLPLPSPAILAMGHEDVVAEAVTYGTIDETPLTGYLAQPTSEPIDGSQPLPGVIVIQEWWGLNENIKAMTRQIANEGYTALAVDLYDDQVADNPDDARTLVQAALQNPDRLTQNVVAAYNYLSDTMAAPTVASLGWCFGGTWSLNTALALPDQLDAAVIYYGGGITTNPGSLSTLQMPIQGHFGLLDTNPDPATVQEFESVLTDLGKDVQIYVYANAGHAFANPSGTRYNKAAADIAWERTMTFLQENL